MDSTVARRITQPQEVSPDKKFVPGVLPWLVAAGALGLYLVTLNHWVSIKSLFTVARISGWLWLPPTTEPLLWLVTFPFRWLPQTLIPIALNLFSAVCAALTLALLARSVALLPHDRTEEQRLREKSAFSLLSIRAAWVPPVLAAVVCGSQLTFWENATAISGEMLNLLLFAYIVRCVLEFRLSERESWLFRAAVVYGAAMANNWGMVGFFPLFVVALVWIKGVSFFDTRFLGRMFLLGLAGLAFYLLLPTVVSWSKGKGVPVGFWQALGSNLREQKAAVFYLVFNKARLLHGLQLDGSRPLWVLGLPSLLPLLALSVRWPSYFGDPSKLGVALATLIIHIFYAMLLVLCLWVALDPAFSPRHYGLPYLSFYYLGALSAGYFSGYFLLVFGTRPSLRPRPFPVYLRLANGAALGAFGLLALLAPTMLIYRNWRQIQTTNGLLLQKYADLIMEALPSNGAMLLSDDPTRLMLAQSALTRSGKAKAFTFVHTQSLPGPDYHRFLARTGPQDWPFEPAKDLKEVSEPFLADLAFRMVETNRLYYLHPSFGYYFEALQPEIHGLLYRLTHYPTNESLSAPKPDKTTVTENEAFWRRIEGSHLQPIIKAISPPNPEQKPGPLERLARKAGLKKENNFTALGLGNWYSHALVFWGVQMQRDGHLPEAAIHFERAQKLNPDNIVAEINLAFNHNLQAGHKTAVKPSKSVEDQFGKYPSWNAILAANGPFDEPSFCFEQGKVFAAGRNYRQAAQQFTRVIELAEENVLSRMMLAQLYLMVNMSDPALKLLKEVHMLAGAEGLDHTSQFQVLYLEAGAHLAKDDLKSAERVVQTALDKSPGDVDLLAKAAEVYITFARYTNALALLDRQLKLRPGEPTALALKGYVHLQLEEYDQAIPPLTQVIGMETNNYSQLHYLALANRAVVYLKSGQLDKAQRDNEVLQKLEPTNYNFEYGLGEIAFRRHDTNSAIRFYQLYLANNPNTNSTEATNIIARLSELKRGVR